MSVCMTGEISLSSRVAPMHHCHGVDIVLQLDKMLTLGRAGVEYTGTFYTFFHNFPVNLLFQNEKLKTTVHECVT